MTMHIFTLSITLLSAALDGSVRLKLWHSGGDVS